MALTGICMHDFNKGAVLVKRKSGQIHVMLDLIHCRCTREGDPRENEVRSAFLE